MSDTVVGRLIYEITGDASHLNKTLSDADKSTKRLGDTGNDTGNKLSDSFKKSSDGGESLLGKVVNIGKAFLAWQGIKIAFNIGKDLVEASSKAEETDNKFRAVYNDIGDQAESAASRMAASYNLSNEASKSMLAATGDVLTGLGMSSEGALDMSIAVNTLASDLVSFQNYEGGVTGASEALTKGLLNQHDALIGLGIVIQDKDIEKYAEGLGKTKDQLTRTELAQANLTLILQQSKNAIGDVARSNDSYANQVRRTEAAIDNMKASMGGVLKVGVTDFLRNLSGVFQSLDDDMGTAGQQTEFVTRAFLLMSRVVYTTIQALVDLGLVVINAGKLLISFFSGEAFTNPKAFADTIYKVGDSITRLGDNFIKNTKLTFSALTEEINKTSSTVEKSAAQSQSMLEQTDAYQKAVSEKLKSYEQDVFNKKVEMAALEIASKEATEKGKFDIAQKYDERLRKLENEHLDATMKNTVSVISQFSSMATQLFSSLQSLSNSYYQEQLDNLEEQRQAELASAGIVTENKLLQLQQQLQDAQAAGDQQLINSTQLAIREEQINQEYADQAEALQREQAHKAWELQLLAAIASSAMAVLNAYMSAAAIPVVGFTIAPIAAAAATVLGGLQIAAVAAAEPPAAAMGMIVPGNDFSGDNRLIRANSNERILTQSDQAVLSDVLRNGGGGLQSISIMIGDTLLYPNIEQAYRDGRLTLSFN